MTQKPTYKELEKKLKVLQESEKRYRKVLQTAIDGFLSHDSDGRILDVNDAYCRMTGYDKQELLNMRVSDLQASASPEEVLLTIENIIDQGGDRFKTRQRRKDGSILDVEVSVQFHPEEKGRLFVFLRDVTEQKRAEEKIRILSSAVEQSIDGIAIANDVKGFTYVNEAFASMHGYTPEEMIGMNIYDVSDPEFLDQVPDIIERLNTDGSYRGEISRIRKDGTSFTVLQSSTAMRFSGSKVRWAVTICRDITEIKQAEREREKLQALLSKSLEIANLAPWEYDVASDRFILNDHFYKLFRTTAEEMGGYEISSAEHARRFIHPDEKIEPLKEILEAMYPESEERLEHRIIFGDGTVGYSLIKFFVVKDSQGKAVRAYGVNQDITERKLDEIEREKLQAQLSNALEIANLAPWEYDISEDLFTFNDHYYRLLRTTAEEVGGYRMSSEEHARRFVHPDDLPSLGSVEEAVETTDPDFGQHKEHRVIYGDGSIGYTSVKIFVSKDSQGKAIRCYGVNQDITERKQREIDREKLQALLSTAVEITNLAPWEYDVANDLFTLNDIFYKIFRTTAEEVGGYTMSSEEFDRRFVHPEENLGPLGKSIDEIEKILDSETPSYHRTIYSDGIVGYTSVRMLVIRDSQGNAVRAYGVNQDITENMKAEEEREKMQFLLSNALGLANLAPWEYDVARDIFTFNDHFYKVFRTTVEEVGGYTMSSEEFAQRFFHPDELRAFEERLRESGNAIDPNSGPFEHRIIFGDGTVGYISVKMFVVKDSVGRTIRTYGASQDITEQKRMEEELVRTQKLESVGLLAGGIAHDFNNILTTILGNTYLAKMEVDPEDEVFELLNDMEIASSRAKALTKQLLTFAKGGAPVKETSSIKEVITKSSIFVLRGSRSSCEFSIAEDLWPVDVDVGLINQVIHNIVLNANQAMPDGGRIRVTGENLIVEDKHGLPVKPGRYVRISIMDHGVGIANEDIAKVFDPFFTKKAEGSGLGLATAYSIVKKHDGHISVESELGESTTFQIYLSASEKKVSEKEEAQVIRGTGKILIMDDEASLRKIAGKILKSLGYEPDFAKEGSEAIEMFKASKETGKPYEAVILDLTVPGGMGGKDTVKKLLEIEPDVKTIVSSGYSDDPVLSNFKQYGFKGILPKPFNPQSLSKTLNEVILDKTGP